MNRSTISSDPVAALSDALRLRLASGQRFAALLGRGNPSGGTGLTALFAHDGDVTALSATLPAGVSMATLEAIAACESGGDPNAVASAR